MTNKNIEPIVLISNPNSTRSAAVENEVARPLEAYAAQNGIELTHVNTRFHSAEDNIKDLIDRLPDQGRVISAAGDGTAEQLINATLQGEKDLQLGLLPYGNFNDMAGTHMDTSQNVIDLLEAPTTDLLPVAVEVNGKHWRHAPAYITLGLTARIAAGFDTEASREKMKGASKPERLIRRLAQAAGDYLKYSGKALPAFRVNGGEIIDDSTDIAISNNTVAAGMIRARDSYYGEPYFGARADLNMRNIFEAASFGTQSLIGRSPLERTEAMRITFEQASSVPIQTGGEFQQFHDVNEIFIYKNPQDIVKILHPKLT